MSFRKDAVIILLGAGASVDAGIPESSMMIENIENFITSSETSHGQWRQFRDLYYFIKSSFLYGDGIQGKFRESKINIERLVNALTELEKKEDHVIYPYIANWNSKLIDVAGPRFEYVSAFKKVILKELKTWVSIRNNNDAAYYRALPQLKHELGFPLRIFTLNYDLCAEKHSGSVPLCNGFNRNRRWDWREFEESEDSDLHLLLYKLHGSIDWERDYFGNLEICDDPAVINNPELIFGTNYKLQYIDPFLFYAYEFRKYSLFAQYIICIGYGFGDEHINGMLRQALRDKDKKILAVQKSDDSSETINIRRRSIAETLHVSIEQVYFDPLSAKEFMTRNLNLAHLSELFYPDAETAELFNIQN